MTTIASRLPLRPALRLDPAAVVAVVLGAILVAAVSAANGGYAATSWGWVTIALAWLGVLTLVLRPHRPGDPSATATSVRVSAEGPGNTKNPKTFVVTVGAADSSRPSGTVLCFDNLVQFASAPLVDGRATCVLTPRPAGTHSITATFRTGDYKKWASSAGNVLTFTVGKG